jgi:hypothetical protein
MISRRPRPRFWWTKGEKRAGQRWAASSGLLRQRSFYSERTLGWTPWAFIGLQGLFDSVKTCGRPSSALAPQAQESKVRAGVSQAELLQDRLTAESNERAVLAQVGEGARVAWRGKPRGTAQGRFGVDWDRATHPGARRALQRCSCESAVQSHQVMPSYLLCIGVFASQTHVIISGPAGRPAAVCQGCGRQGGLRVARRRRRGGEKAGGGRPRPREAAGAGRRAGARRSAARGTENSSGWRGTAGLAAQC